jgi:hypothetical protein
MAPEENRLPPRGGKNFVIYTDGSKMEGTAGYAWAVTRGLQVIGETRDALATAALSSKGK